MVTEMTEHTIALVKAERQRQYALWGDQSENHPFEWMSILGEEYGELCEAVNETYFKNGTHLERGGHEKIICEATQVAAVAVALIESIKKQADKTEWILYGGVTKMDISRSEYHCLKNMSNDLLKFEECINSIGIETRIGEDEDDFRNFYDILGDVARVVWNNPTLLDDVKAKSFTTLDEEATFLRQYNLTGVECVTHIKG